MGPSMNLVIPFPNVRVTRLQLFHKRRDGPSLYKEGCSIMCVLGVGPFLYSCLSSPSWSAVSLSHRDYLECILVGKFLEMPSLKMAPLEMLPLKCTSLMPPISNLISVFAICTVMKSNNIRAQK